MSATLLYSLSHLTLKSKMRTHFWPQHTFQQPRKKRQPIISYSDYLIRVSKYYNRYQVSYTVYSKEGYTIGVCYHLIGEVYWIRRYTGVYKPLCMRSFPDLSLPGESAQPEATQRQWAVSSAGRIKLRHCKKERHYSIYTLIINYLVLPFGPTRRSQI